MQWSADRNGGFSDAAPSRLVSKPPSDGYAPEHVNVAAQIEDRDSLLHFFRDLISRYRISPELGWGEFEVLSEEGSRVLVHSLRADLGRMVAVHNFADVPAVVRFGVDDEPEGAALVDLLGAHRIDLRAGGSVELEVAPYGYRWFRVSRPGDGRVT